MRDHTVSKATEDAAIRNGVFLVYLIHHGLADTPPVAAIEAGSGLTVRNDNEVWVRSELERLGIKILGEIKAPQATSVNDKEVVLHGGGYRFWLDESGALRCDRNGTAWRDFIADKAVHALFDEVIARVPRPVAGSHWDEDAQFPVQDWRFEVVNDRTRLGYQCWVEHQREIAANVEPSAGT